MRSHLFALVLVIFLSTVGAVAAQQAPPASAPFPPTVQPAVQRIYPDLAHIGIVVADIDKAVAETLQRFGLDRSKITTRMTLKVVDGLYKGHKVSFSADFCLIEIGNTELEFIQPVGNNPSPYLDALQRRGDAPHHVAFFVDSIDAQLAKERETNPQLMVVFDARIQGGSGRYVYVDGIIPGILVEYFHISRAPNRP